jgi:membrane dipeptidase
MSLNIIVDGHLDLAYGQIFYERDLERLSPTQIRELEAASPPLERGLCTTTISEMRRGYVGLAFATLFASPAEQWTHPGIIDPQGYRSAEEAHAQALAQLELYESWATRGTIRIIGSRTDLTHHLELWAEDRVPGIVILMEGADPIRQPDELEFWWARGVRIIGTSWGATRYGGGTEAPGGLTEIGRELVGAMQARGVILDASHQSWEAFWESLDIGVHRVIASHSNAFALRPTTNRHLTDAMLRAIAERDGCVGLVLLNTFLEPRWNRLDRRVPVTLEHQVKRMLEHLASVIGWDKVGIGSDSDGGFGALESPEGFDTIADLSRLGDLVPHAHRAGVLGENWLEFLRTALPK